MISAARLLKAASRHPAASAVLRRAPLRWPRSSRRYEGDLVCEGSDRPYAIVSTVTDNFVGVGSAFLLSLHERLARRDRVDVILVQADRVAPLSAENRAALARLCPGLRIVDVDASFLTAENMTRYDHRGRPIGVTLDTQVLPSKRAAYVKLNVLRFTQYDKVVLMDSDLMVLDDFSELFDLEADIAATPAGKRRPEGWRTTIPRWAFRGRFNSGVLLLSRRCRGAAPFNAAVDFLDAKRAKRLRDQSVLNELFRRAGKELLPTAYNYKLNKADPKMLDDVAALSTAKIIHVVGTSKWELKQRRNEGRPVYDRFHELQRRTGVPFILEG